MKLLSSWKTGRAAVALGDGRGGGLPFSFVYIFSSLPTCLLVAFIVPFLEPLAFSSTFGPQPRQPCQLCQPRCGLSLQPVVIGYPHLRSALNYLMSYLLGSLSPRAFVIWDASRGFICDRRRSQREADNYNISPTAGR